MHNIDFHNIAVLGESKQSSFEDVCMYLCCRELKVSSIDSYKNQPGIETEPISINKDKIGFQVKYFQSKFDWAQIQHSLLGAKNVSTKSKKYDLIFPDNVFKNYSLTKVYIYSNKEKTLTGRNKTKAEKLIDIISNKYGCSVSYICEKALQVKLSIPSNKDLAQLYFGAGDELGLINKTIPPETLTFLSSSEYLKIPISDNLGNKISSLNRRVLDETSGISLLIGSPGSGKSVIIRKLFHELGGLNQATDEKRVRLLTKNNAIPILINLKDCAFDSIDNLVRNIKSDFDISNSTLGFAYLFDGLDELSEEKLDSVLSYIHHLSSTESSCRIILSCRKGNFNKRRLHSYFPSINEVLIQDLRSKDIDSYFSGRNNKKKVSLLKALKKSNPSLLFDIKDILLTDLLWQTIENITEDSSVIDLLEKKISLLMESPSHINSLNALNLLNPKKEKIIDLLQNISFEYHDKRKNKFQFRFYISELQQLILNHLPKLDYSATNKIINYISDLFFDTSEIMSGGISETYIFRHRRYQEYFFVQKLKKEYEREPGILRQLKVISSKDFFEDFFLVYLRSEYLSEKNIQGLVDLNLIDVYLGNHSGFGVDDNDYFGSNEFFGCLLAQSEDTYEEILGDNDLGIEARLFISIDAVNDLIKKTTEHDGGDDFYKIEDELKLLWEEKVSTLVHYSVRFWKSGRETISLSLQVNISEVMEIIESSNVLERFDSDFNHPYWNSFEDYLYLKIIIKGQPPIDCLNEVVRGNYENFSSNESYSSSESGKAKLINSYLRVIFHLRADEISEVFDSLDVDERNYILPMLVDIGGLELIFSNEIFKNKLIEYARSVVAKSSQLNISIIALKKIFDIRLNKNELQYSQERWDEIRNERPIDWGFRGSVKSYAISSYILDKHSFDEYLKPQAGHSFRHYNEQGLYAALYEGLIRIVIGKDSAESVVGQFVKYINFFYEGRESHNYLSSDMSRLLADVLSRGEDTEKLKPYINIISTYDNKFFNLYLFYLHLNKEAPDTFNKVITQDNLVPIVDMLSNWEEEYKEYVDMCFSFSRMLSGLDDNKAKEYFYKGVNDGILRHGWRKDTLVSYSLVEALEILWAIGAESKTILIDYTSKVFDLARKVVDITDGKGTIRGPYNVLKLISKYDHNHTEYLYDQLDGNSWEMNIATAAIINSKIRFGIESEEVYTFFSRFRKYFSYRGGVDPEYYNQKIICLINFSKSYLYTYDEKKEAFDKCTVLIEEGTNEEECSFLKDNEFIDVKNDYNDLCESYGLDRYFETSALETENKEEGINEVEFIQRVKEADTDQKLCGLYEQLSDYQNKITLSDRESWEILIDRTQDLCGNIEPLTALLKKHHYPHSDWYSHNSKYFHLGLSVALTNMNTKDQIFMYLTDNTGHGGFSNLIKAYSIHNDKHMCLGLFDRYLQLCDLLVR